MMMYKKMILMGMMIFAISAGFATADEKVLTIGVSGVYSGGFAVSGKNVSDGESDYLKWKANQGGIEYKDPVTGKTEKVNLKVLIEDNQYNVSKAVEIYNKFKAQGVNAIIGFGSTPGEACSALASKDQIPYFSWYSYASPSGYKPKPQYYWSLLPTVAEGITPMIRWFVTKKQAETKTPKLGIIAANVPSWQILKKPGLMDGYVKSIGGRLVGIEMIPLVATDYSAQIGKLVFEQNADGIILVGTLSQTVIIAKDLKRMGIDPKKIPVVCSVSAWDESLFTSIPSEIEGIYGEVHVVSVDSDVAGMKIVRDTAKSAGKDSAKIVINYINGIVGSMVLETAIRRALEKHGYEKVSKSGEAVRDELHNFKTFDPFGLAPPIEVRYPDEPYFLNYARIVEAKNGKFADAGDWIAVDRIKGALE